jgi:hypothetical protein
MSRPFLNQVKFENMLRERLRSSQMPSVEEHPDAALFSGYAANSLNPSERASLVQHLAVCPTCRETLFLVSGGHAGTTAMSRASGFRDTLSKGWIWIPATAALACAILSLPPGVHQSPAVRTEPRRPAKVFVPPPSRSRPTVFDAATTRNITLPAPPDLAPSPISKTTLPVLALPVTPPPPPEIAALPVPKKGAAFFGDTVPPPPAASEIDSDSRSQLAAPQNSASRGRPGGFSGFRPPVARAIPRSTIAAGPPAMLWTIPPDSRPGAVQRSASQGQSRETIHIADRVAFHAVAAFGPHVWAGGSDGALFHSSDNGGHWSRVAVANGATRIRDAITSINAKSPSAVEIRTSSGESWTTADGGEHWTQIR